MERQKKIKVAILLIIAAIFIAVLTFFFARAYLPQAPLSAAVTINTDKQPTLGNPQATLHIVAFEDLKCMNCAHFNNTLFQTIQKDYIDTGKASYTLINLAFIPGSMPAASAARCVYQQSPALFFKYIEAIYKNQPPENQNWATVPTLLTFAGEIKGIDSDKLADCMVSNTSNQDFITNNLSIAKAVMKPPVSTPAVYVNGVLVTPLSKKQFEHVVSKVQK